MKSKYCKVVSMLLTVVLVLGALVYATPESPQETSENSSMIGETDENSMENEPLPNETSVFSEINEQADLSEESSDSLSDETDDSEIPTSAPSAETYEENESITSNQGTRPVEITVLSRNGDIIENASVSINGEQRTVDSDGVVFFDSVPFGYVEVSVSADGYSSLRTTIGVPENSTDVYNKSVIMTSVVYDDIINSADLYSIQEDTPSALSLDDEEVLESAAANSNDEIYTTYTSAFYGNYGEVSFNTVSGDCIAYNESIYIIDANATVQYRMWDGEWAIHPKCPGGNNGCAAEVNGKIYFFATLMDAEYYDYVYVFDTDTNTWSDTNCDVPLGVFSANVVNGKIYCFNGEVMYIFDPATNEIASIQNSGPSIPMTKCSSIVYKNEIHFTGMVNDEPEEANAVMIYDTVKNEWSGGNARPNYSIHGCGGGTFLNLGGYCIYQGGASADDPDDGVTYETTPYIYMPGLSEWHTFDTNVNINIGGTKERWEWASACAYNNKVYFVCESPTESGHSAFAVTHFAEVAASHKRAASGARHMVYIDNDNKVRTIGDNSYGQLGNGTNTSSTEFTETAMQWNTDITNFPRKVAAGNATTYLLTTNNELYAWGDNSCGQFGNGTKISSNVPVKIMDDVVDVEAGAKHAIIQKSNGNIYTFGDNTYGQLGVGDTDEYIGAVYIGDMASRIEAGDYQSYYITKYGQTLYGCGKNNNGQLGIGDTTNRSEFVLVLDDVASVSCGKDHSIALKSNGDVCVWGNNTFGQLGVELNEGAAYTVNPVMLPVVNASNVYAGANSSAYTVGGVLYQCGEGMPNPNSFSQITNISSETFGDMDGCIALGNYCIAVDSAGKPWQWGMMTETDDIFGKSYTYIPQKVNYGFDIELIDSYRTQTLAVDSGGSLLAWGTGYFADGTDKEATHTYPKIISGVENIVQVSRGKNHNLVLDQDGDVWGWGSNSNAPMGALGGKVKTVTKLSGISDVKQLSAGTEFSIFLKNDGTLWGVGKNNTGQLGQGNTTNSSAPVQITDKDDFISVDTGEDFVAALASDGLYVWGGNSYGQLGTGGIDAELTPYKLNISLQDGEEISCIKTGPDYCLMLTSSGNVYSWGRNTMGQLGLGNKTNQTLPTKIASLQNIKYISTGYNQSFAVKEDGKVYGFGGGNNGQLGIANTGSNQTPVQISNLTNINAVKIVGGNGYSIAVDEYGYMYSFGTKEGGVLGLYSTSADTFDNQAKKEREWLNQYMEQYGYEITEDLSLPMISNNGYSITWESSDESHLSSTGSVMKPDIFSEDASVILTARIWYGDKYVTAKFEYLINKVEDTLLTADIPERVKNNVMNTNEENINTNIIINDEDSDENEEENSISLMSAHVHSDSFREINQTKNILLNKSMSVFNNRISAGDKVTTILESPDNCFYSVGLQGSAYTLKGMGNTDNFFYNSNIAVSNMVVSQDTTLNFIAFSTNALYPSNSNTRVREFTSCNPDMFEPNQNIFEAGLNYNGTVYGQNNYNSFNQIIGSHEKEVPKTRLNLDSAADVDMFAVDLNPGEKISICVEMYCSKDISDEYVIGVLSDCEVYSDVFNNEGNRELCSTCDLYLCESFAAEESQTQQTRYATWVAQHTSGTKRYYIAVGKYGIDFEIGNRIDYDLTVTKVEKSEWNDYNEEQQAWLTDGREVTLTNDFIILNSEISAESISNNQVQSGAIDNQLDIDWFHYKPEIDEIKTFVLEGYPMMILYSNEQILAKDRSISYYLNQGQDYFIGVYCPDGYYNNDNNEIKIKNNPNYTLKVESGTGNNNVLNFTPKSGGKFIYSSNPERIDEEYLAESGNMLDNYENLSPGKYTYMAWYHNGTSSPIYTDVLFNSNSAQIRINKLGLQVFPSRESPRWTGIQAYSDFIGKTIDNSLETHPYNPSACYPTELDLPKTYDINTNVQSRWLSDIYYDAYGEYYPDMENYNEPIYIIMEFEVLSGSPSLSTIAYKTTSDKTQFMLYNAPYIQDVTVATYTSGSPTWKGFADYKPIVETNLSHTIEASVNTDGYSIPMVVQNTFGTITTSNWVTNLNPQNDVSAYPYIAESSMLAFDYIDERNWKFDTKHTSMKNIPEGYIGSNFIPNDTLPYLTLPPGEIIPDGEYVGFKKQQISISQGNYSVENVYNIAVTNNTNSTWKFNYKTTSKSGIVVGISADGDEMLYSCSGSFDDPNDSAVKNGRYVGRTVSIPAQSTVNITVSVVLTTGDAGWINNEFYVSKEY